MPPLTVTVAKEMISSEAGSSPVISRSITVKPASRHGGLGRRELGIPIRAQRAGVRGRHVYRREGRPPPSERCTARDLPERVPEVAAGERIELLRVQAVVGLAALLELVDLVLEAQGAEQLVGLLEHSGGRLA